MSDTPTTTVVTPPSPGPVVTTMTPREPILSQLFLIAIFGMMIVAGVMVAVMVKNDLSPIQASLASAVISLILGGVMGYYFGSAKSGATKDATIATLAGAPPAATGATTVTTTAPTTTTTTTEPVKPAATTGATP